MKTYGAIIGKYGVYAEKYELDKRLVYAMCNTIPDAEQQVIVIFETSETDQKFTLEGWRDMRIWPEKTLEAQIKTWAAIYDEYTVQQEIMVQHVSSTGYKYETKTKITPKFNRLPKFHDRVKTEGPKRADEMRKTRESVGRNYTRRTEKSFAALDRIANAKEVSPPDFSATHNPTTKEEDGARVMRDAGALTGKRLAELAATRDVERYTADVKRRHKNDLHFRIIPPNYPKKTYTAMYESENLKIVITFTNTEKRAVLAVSNLKTGTQLPAKAYPSYEAAYAAAKEQHAQYHILLGAIPQVSNENNQYE